MSIRELTVAPLSGFNKAKETWPGQYCPSFCISPGTHVSYDQTKQGPPTMVSTNWRYYGAFYLETLLWRRFSSAACNSRQSVLCVAMQLSIC